MASAYRKPLRWLKGREKEEEKPTGSYPRRRKPSPRSAVLVLIRVLSPSHSFSGFPWVEGRGAGGLHTTGSDKIHVCQSGSHSLSLSRAIADGNKGGSDGGCVCVCIFFC
ncbi:hypothetical protein H107_03174 [Trichophyton rubrum CBS 202.88]|nr:hypothetical protein H104_03066 [Trichophyton rubrum CBS 289.86]EZG18353.1 hypothetical protein H107_03174 [Trichophyton rubrum CBS 202.88]